MKDFYWQECKECSQAAAEDTAGVDPVGAEAGEHAELAEGGGNVTDPLDAHQITHSCPERMG